ncbi:hypothetical protein JCM8547_006640 [Rhodosporidiobolus lusitaniae]
MSPVPLPLSSVHLHYFPICGRAEPLRYFLADANIPYTESNDVAAFREKKMDLEEYRFGQLPRLTINGTHLFQQGAMLRFLAKSQGYTGAGDLFQDALVDQLQDACEDLNVAYVNKIYTPNARELLVPFVKDYVPKVLAQFEHLFAKNQASSGYLAYDKPSYAEFHLLYLLHALSYLNTLLLADYPTLESWVKLMKARPGLKAYFEGGQKHVMLNGSESGQTPVV